MGSGHSSCRGLRADRRRWACATGEASSGTAAGGTLGVPRRQGGAGRDTGSGPDPRARGGAGDQGGGKCLAPFTFASHGYEAFHLLMPLYVCRTWEGEVTAQQGQELAWVRANRLGRLRDAAGGRAAEGNAAGPALGSRAAKEGGEALEHACAVATLCSRFVRDKRGTTAIEYGLIARWWPSACSPACRRSAPATPAAGATPPTRSPTP